jgi:hypothetical protein
MFRGVFMLLLIRLSGFCITICLATAEEDKEDKEDAKKYKNGGEKRLELIYS